MTPRLAAAALAALALAGACEHAQPFGPPAPEAAQPFSTAYPRRLTFNLLGDVQPAWLPGDSGIIYSVSTGDAEEAHCLGILPPGGGHLVQTDCHPPGFAGDSTTALWLPAVRRHGYLAYLREVSPIGAVTPDTSALVLASLSVPDPGRALLQLPYTAPDGTLQSGLRDLCWLGDGSLVYLGGVLAYSYPPYPWDTTFAPLEIMRADLVGDSIQLSVVPGTAGATSVATDSLANLYYTRLGDTRVYRLLGGTSSATVWYDFGALGVPSAIGVAGQVLVAAVNDSVYAVHVGSGAPVSLALPDSLVVTNLALSPSGTRVVVEGSEGGAAPDLWLLEVP